MCEKKLTNALFYAPIQRPQFTGKWWFDLLMLITYVYNTTVRPTISYLIIASYIYVKFAQIKILEASGITAYEAVVRAWTENDTMFMFTLVTFWFGGRQILRSMGKIK